MISRIHQISPAFLDIRGFLVGTEHVSSPPKCVQEK
jgi:hypothetical protein